jgi:hypothetical protein
MRFPFSDDLIVTNGFDPEMAMLADRHYSRRTPGARQFLNNGRKLVIRDASGLVLFGWIWAKEGMRFDNQEGYNCAIFRNESARRSSDIILECERLAIDKWGPARMFTYVNPAKIASRNPGYCFKMAGWKNARNEDGTIRISEAGQHLLFKE